MLATRMEKMIGEGYSYAWKAILVFLVTACLWAWVGVLAARYFGGQP